MSSTRRVIGWLFIKSSMLSLVYQCSAHGPNSYRKAFTLPSLSSTPIGELSFASAAYRQLLPQTPSARFDDSQGPATIMPLIESFWSTLKYNWSIISIRHPRPARTRHLRYIETFYNRTNSTPVLTTRAPIIFESQLKPNYPY